MSARDRFKPTPEHEMAQHRANGGRSAQIKAALAKAGERPSETFDYDRALAGLRAILEQLDRIRQ